MEGRRETKSHQMTSARAELSQGLYDGIQQFINRLMRALHWGKRGALGWCTLVERTGIVFHVAVSLNLASYWTPISARIPIDATDSLWDLLTVNTEQSAQPTKHGRPSVPNTRGLETKVWCASSIPKFRWRCGAQLCSRSTRDGQPEMALVAPEVVGAPLDLAIGVAMETDIGLWHGDCCHHGNS